MTQETGPQDPPRGEADTQPPLLAEALAQRAALQRSVSDLTKRASASAVYGEGETPPEDVNALIRQITDQVAQLGQLIGAINRVNLTAVLTYPDGMTLTDALAARDALDLRMKCLREITDSAAGTSRSGFGYRRISRSEIRDVTDLNIPARRAELDGLARTRRELDLAIQQANWTTRLGG